MRMRVTRAPCTSVPMLHPDCRQDRKLKEGFARLQQENEALRRQLAMLHKGGGGGMQMGGPPTLGLGAGGNGRVSRMNVLGAEDGLMLRPGTALAPRWGGTQSWVPTQLLLEGVLKERKQ